MFQFWRPRAEFPIGEIVKRLNPEYPGSRYMHIKRRRFISPNGTTKKRWVYDGWLFDIKDGEIVYTATIAGVSENSITGIKKAF